MVRFAKGTAILALAMLVTSTGGCVLKSTHDEVLAKLSGTEAHLQLSQAENSRLRTGLTTLAGDVGQTATKVEAMDSSVQQLEAGGKDVEARLTELQTLVASQVKMVVTLGQAVGPLKDEIDALRVKLSALAANRPVPGPGVAASPQP